MRTGDLIALCLQNLFRRKARTFLTVLGVVVGACSIIIMISIGIGMKESQEKMLSQMGDLTIITVRKGGAQNAGAKLDDSVVRELRLLDGVETVTPKLSFEDASVSAVVYAGIGRRYKMDYLTCVGIEKDAMDKIGLVLLEGENPSGKRGSALIGENAAYGFMDTKRPEGRNMVDMYANYNDYDGTGALPEKPEPFFDPMKSELELVITVDGESGRTITRRLRPSGRVKEDYNKGYETSSGIILSLEELRDILREVSRESGGKIKVPTTYQNVLVKCKDIASVSSVEQSVLQMGFSADSMESIRKPMEKEAQQKQLMLGGLGAISLLVAAIGITNTMIMSISERTREIGIMKSLGCFVHDVRKLFLMEAGAIGFMGGIAGILVSSVISAVMNLFSAQIPIDSAHALYEVLTTPGSRTSVIPWWLLVFSLGFSILIGLVSGYYPARKAVGIPAIEAIRHE